MIHVLILKQAQKKKKKDSTYMLREVQQPEKDLNIYGESHPQAEQVTYKQRNPQTFREINIETRRKINIFRSKKWI